MPDLLLFVILAAIIAAAGTRMTKAADEIAALSGLGEAVMGAVFLGACTSLSGSVMSMAAAWQNHAELAVSNAIGGIALQTLFLAIADLSYRKANLEHVAASHENLAQCATLAGLLALPPLATFGPDVTLGHIHPMTLALPLAYGFGIHQLRRMRALPMWYPRLTPATQREEHEEADNTRSLPRLWMDFTAMAVLLGLSGYGLASLAPEIAREYSLSQTVFGSLFTALTTSLPELITVLAAVRRAAFTLAIGDIIGGNMFDVLFLAFSDLMYRPGSIYHTIADKQLFMIALTILMTSILLLGLLRRERYGVAHIGFESIALFGIYGIGMAVMIVG